MQIVRNLNDEQLTELLVESDERYIRRTFGNLAESTSEAAEQPDCFWQRQRIEIRSKISAYEKLSSRAVMTLASAVALVLIGAVLIRPVSPATPVTPQPDPDQELLMSVEHAVGSDVPAALEPAALLSDEIISDSQPRSASHQKENNHEDY